MVLQTIIYRLGDGLPLCSSSSSSLEVEDLSKQQVRSTLLVVLLL